MEISSNRYTLGGTLRAAVVVLITTILAGNALADFQSLARRLPAASNAVVAVNVSKLLESPYGKKQEWAATMAENWAQRPLMVPPGVTKLVMGADLDPKTVDPVWQMCLMEMSPMPSLDSLTQSQRGSIDRIWDKNAVLSAQNAYFVPLDEKVLASLTPASRRAIAKWLREPVKAEGNLTSDYLQKVVLGLNDDTAVSMSLDLEGTFAVPAVRKWLDDTDIPELDGKDLDAIARSFGKLQGLTLTANVDQDIMGKAVVQFEDDASALAPVAKPLILGVLKYAGMRLPDLDDWKFAASGKSITLEGKLSETTLRMLLSLVQSPIPASGATEGSPSQSASSAQPADPGVASQRYFKFITMMLDNLHASTSLSDTSTWFKNAARRIEKAPILNVDPALVEWGGMVTTKLKEVAAATAIGQTQTNAATAGLQSTPVDYGAYSYDSNGVYHSQIAANGEANRQQRRQAASAQKAASHQQGLQILQDIPASRAKIRAEMTAKYKMEF